MKTTQTRLKSLATFGLLGALPFAASAAPVTLTGSDAANSSSFNTAGLWNNAAAPSAGNDYFTGDNVLRTPASGGSFTFGGDSLTINNTGAYPQGLLFKGTGATGIITVNNLIFSGGRLSHANGLTDLMNLAGNLNVLTTGEIYAKQGDLTITASLTGAGTLTIAQTDAPTEDRRYVNLLGNNSGFTGKLFVAGRLRVTSEAGLGGNPAVFTPDLFTLDNANNANGGWLTVTNTFTIDDANRGITLGAAGGQIFVTNPDANTVVNLTIASPIAGGNLIKRGGGVLTLAGNNSHAGVTLRTATAGSQLNLNSVNALGTGALTIFADANEALLDNTSGSTVTLAATGAGQQWNRSFTFRGTSALAMAPLGPVTLGAAVTATLTNNALAVGSLDGGFAFTKAGSGNLTVDGGVLISGNLTANGGSLILTGVGDVQSPVITITSNATLNVASFSDNGTPGLVLNFGQTLAAAGTISGNVSDGGATTTIINPGNGTGTLTISGNLELAGGGTLNFDLSPIPTVGGGVNDLIVVGGQLSFNNTAGPTALNIIGSTGSGVTYTLFQYNSFAGSIGNLTVPPGFALTNNTATKTIQLISSHVPANLTWRGDGVLNAWDVGTTANWIQSGTNQLFFSSDTVTFDNTGSNNLPVTLAVDVSPSAVIVNASQDYVLAGAGIATGSLTKSGSGMLVLDNTNTYSGPTIINAGTLQLGDTTAGSFGLSGTIGSGPVTNHGVLQFNRSGGAPINIAANIAGSGSISNLSTGGSVVLAGTVSGTTVNQAGFGGFMRLAGSNDYTGLTTVSGGTLSVQNSNALGSAASGTIVDGGILYFDLNQPMVFNGDPITLRNNGTLARGGGQTLALFSPVAVEASNGRVQVDGGSTITLSNTLSGAGAIEKIQSGNLVLAAANSFSGGLTVSAGTLTLAHSNAIGNNAGITVVSTTGGVGLSGTRVTLAEGVTTPAGKSLTLPSSGPGTVRSTLFATGPGLTNTWAGPVTITGDLDSFNAVGFGVDANSVFVISGNVSADPSFAGRVNMRGSATGLGIVTGKFTLSPASSSFVVDDGSTWVVTSTGNVWATNFFAGSSTLRVGVNNALPVASSLFVGNGTANRLDLGGFNQQLGSMDATGVNITNTSPSADSTLTLNATSASTFGGRIGDGERKLNLNVAAGTLILTNATSLNLPKSTVTVAGSGVLQLGYAGTNQVNGLVLNGVSQPAGYYSGATSAPYLAGPGTLLVQPGPGGPATLTNVISGNTLNLSWPAGQGWRLQGQTNSLNAGLGPNWVYLTDGSVNSTNIPVNPANPTVFFRLKYP